jgi:GxxExxY protein
MTDKEARRGRVNKEPRKPGGRTIANKEPRKPGGRTIANKEPRKPGGRANANKEPRKPGGRTLANKEPRKPGIGREGGVGALEGEEVTGQIIGAAIEVHRRLGPGFLESVYEKALAIEMDLRGISYERQYAVPVAYRGVEVGAHRLDIFVHGSIVVELKTVTELLNHHFVVVRSYLAAVGQKHGLLLNFAKPTLEVKRVHART